ncbi:MAG: hypothetical protein F6K36_23000 [Symploca sp. SIO3C6]|nr:hypothetical protein [Symploca sp. SIO3C6]
MSLKSAILGLVTWCFVAGFISHLLGRNSVIGMGYGAGLFCCLYVAVDISEEYGTTPTQKYTKYRVKVVLPVASSGEIDVPVEQEPAEYLEELYNRGEIVTEPIGENCSEIQIVNENGRVYKIFQHQHSFLR